jgi:flotillin
VQEVGKANIAKQVQIVVAEQNKQVAITRAEGEKQQTVTLAEGNLASAKLLAQGVQAQGEAKGAADTAIQMATVNPQITLAKEIGGNDGYQRYLLGMKSIDAGQAVGIAQAEALKAADIKVIANTGTPSDGIASVRDLFTSKGGQAIGAALEGLRNTDTGAAVLTAITGDKGKK